MGADVSAARRAHAERVGFERTTEDWRAVVEDRAVDAVSITLPNAMHREVAPWRFFRADAGSGALGDLMAHIVDMTHFLVGPIERLSGRTATLIPRRPRLAFGEGTHFSRVDTGELVDVENERHMTVVAGAQHPGFAAFQPGAGVPMGYDDLRVLEAASVLEASRDGEQRGPGLEEMRATARVLEAIERSGRSGEWEPAR